VGWFAFPRLLREKVRKTRRTKKEQEEAIINIHRSIDPSSDYSIEDLKDKITYFLVHKESDQIKGHITIASNGRSYFVCDLAIHRDFQKQKGGTILMTKIFHKALKSQFSVELFYRADSKN
jgi:N-acetylglutamate synthase-like GNAT family acetyltransferase